MGIPFPGLLHRATSALSMDRECNSVPMDHHQVVIDISHSDESISNSSHDHNVIGLPRDQNAVQPSSNERTTNDQPVFSSVDGGIDTRNSVIRRASGRARNISPLNYGLWILVELVLTLSQVVAAIVVLLLSKNEHPRTPLRLWVIGYASGCVAILPLLYWRYHYRNQRAERESSQSNEINLSVRASSTASTAATSDGHNTNNSDPRGAVSIRIPNPRLKVFVEYYKMASDCFFAVWFVAGIVWVSGGHASAAEASNLYRVSIVLLTFSCIGYAMPFILCTTICCCLPCIISVLGFREDPTQSRGATSESINSLPTYKFKVKKAKNNDREKGVVDGGIVTTGTGERMLSGEDAVCCICLAKYANNDELKELPCSHFFHKECIDKWLKINATCPLCKAEVGQTIVQALTEATANLRPGTLA